MMKNIMKKLFISALVVSAASLATTSAITINVGNRSSHGILNLDRLVIKASTANDAADAVVLTSGSKIWVTKICNTGLTVCKNVTDLWTGTDTHYTNYLKIKWNWTDAVIFTQNSDKTLNIVGSGNTTVSTSGATITIYSSGGSNNNTHYESHNIVGTSTSTSNATSTDNTNTYLNHIENNVITSSGQIKGTGSVTVSSQNGTIIISGSDSDTHYTNYLKVQWNWTDAVSFTQNSDKTLNIVGSGNTTVSATNGTITIYSTGGSNNNNNHTTWKNIIGNSSTATSQASSTNNTNTYINHVEGTTNTSSNQIKGTGSVTVSSQSGTITISGSDTNTWQPNTSSQNGYVTTWWSKGQVRKVDNNGNPGWGTDATSNITISWTTNYYCYKVNDTKINCNLDSGTLATKNDLEWLSSNIYEYIENISGDIINNVTGYTTNYITQNITQMIQNSISWTSWMWCTYVCDETRIEGGKTVCIAWHIECNTPAPTWWNWDSKWTWDSTIYPINLAKTTVAIWTSSSWNHTLNVNWNVQFTPAANARASFEDGWITFFSNYRLKMNLYSYQKNNNDLIISKSLQRSWPWLTVNWPIAVWNQNSYIYMYATGDWTYFNRDHFEIMWKDQLAVWAQGASFIYFKKSNEGYKSWWSWYLPEYYSLAASQTQTDYTATQSNSSLGYHDAFESLMVWVNTNNPHATLDVNGSLRVWSNCMPKSMYCDSTRAWTIIYFVDTSNVWQFVVCRQTWIGWNGLPTFSWRNLITWATWSRLQDMWYEESNNCFIPSPTSWSVLNEVSVWVMEMEPASEK